MGKSYSILRVTNDELVNIDWHYKGRIYRFYPSGVLLVKSPGRQSSFEWKLEHTEDWTFVIIEREKFIAKTLKTDPVKLQLTRLGLGKITHELLNKKIEWIDNSEFYYT